jgi:hypothetical protein
VIHHKSCPHYHNMMLQYVVTLQVCTYHSTAIYRLLYVQCRFIFCCTRNWSDWKAVCNYENVLLLILFHILTDFFFLLFEQDITNILGHLELAVPVFECHTYTLTPAYEHLMNIRLQGSVCRSVYWHVRFTVGDLKTVVEIKRKCVMYICTIAYRRVYIMFWLTVHHNTGRFSH